MSVGDDITAETIEQIKKAQTAGVTSGTGILGVDLSDLISLIPVNTPFRDQLARTKPKMGAKFAEWRALVNINNTQPNPFTAFDYAAPIANVDEMDVTALYAKIGMGYTVTQDAIDLAGGYADAKAVAVFNALNQFKIGEDKGGIGGCLFALTTPATPTVSQSDTGGSIAASTAVNVKVAARTGANYFWGGSTVASAQGTVTTSTVAAATHSATATVAAVRGAVAYDWFVAGFYYTTTTVNTVTITSIPVANQAVPNLPDIYGTAPAAVPVADSSAGANQFNGLLATLAGDYATGGATGLVTPGSGVTSGAYFHSLDGAAFTVSGASVKELDDLNQSIYDTVRLSPDAYMMSSQQGTELSNVILSTTSSETFFQPNLAGRSEAVLGAFVGWYVNKAAGGTPIRVEVHPHMPPGTLIARTDRVPFPNSNITNTLEMRCLRDLADYEYAANRQANTAGGGPRFDGETYANETLINKAPVAMGVLQNIK
ncbi:MAG TPA: hypothetical protein VIN75_18965 [Burkholderiaceae bacterium]